MSNGFTGADVAQLRQLAAAMHGAGNRLQLQLGTFNTRVNGTLWPGPDAEQFRHDWKTSHTLVLREAVLFLHQSADELTRNADEQEAASLPGGSGPSTGPAGSSNGTSEYTSGPVRPDVLMGKSAAQIKDWWSGLTAGQKQAFIRDYPVEAGNTNGIPFDARVEANRINAQNRIDWLNENDPEPRFNPFLMDAGYPQRFTDEHKAWEKRQSYLQRVVDGKIRLAAYDPAAQSIVELKGTYDENTTTVITYVPGTTTNEASFHDGGPQRLPARLVEDDQSGGTAAFVYKGSEFPDGDFVEAFLVEAKSDEFVARSAPVLRAFQGAVDLELPPGAQSVGVGHSWGVRNLTGAENEGAHYDKLLALSGAAMPPGWVPDPGTEYSSFTYPDILLTAEANGVVGENYPMKEPAFEKHVYEPPGGNGWTEFYSIDNHSLIATTYEENDQALRDMRKEIRQ
ncbi:WXG100 family type VII secretion target [Pseudarthrobacter sp. NPDC055928]|uniref:WXG100 family type VII secretion target n=1 Tax=Pseudarthrobacter sp. NPDC055928 TaxID=3345661 RepID=UPI0035DD7698